MSAPPLETPRMHALSRQALERIRGEQIRFHDERAVILPEYRMYKSLETDAANKRDADKVIRDRAREPLSAEQLRQRRKAEHDTDAPESLVRARRQAEWAARLAVAERAYQATAAEHALAAQAAQLREDLLRARYEVAKAAAQRHYDLAMRRICTYLQVLVRKHADGGELNARIGPTIGPELPKWVTAADDFYLWNDGEHT